MKHFKFSRKLASNIILLHEKHLQCKCTGNYSHVFGIFRILKLARTIADLDGKEDIQYIHLQEAVFYRNSGRIAGEEGEI